MSKTINDIELAKSLSALAIMCVIEGSDNCDLTLSTSTGKIKCHIEFDFEVVEEWSEQF